MIILKLINTCFVLDNSQQSCINVCPCLLWLAVSYKYKLVTLLDLSLETCKMRRKCWDIYIYFYRAFSAIFPSKVLLINTPCRERENSWKGLHANKNKYRSRGPVLCHEAGCKEAPAVHLTQVDRSELPYEQNPFSSRIQNFVNKKSVENVESLPRDLTFYWLQL